jgi:hypothetical protein
LAAEREHCRGRSFFTLGLQHLPKQEKRSSEVGLKQRGKAFAGNLRVGIADSRLVAKQHLSAFAF